MAAIDVVDTHAFLWYLASDARLSSTAKLALDDPARELVLPAIVVAEMLFIIERGKSPLSVAEIWRVIHEHANLAVYPLDEAVLQRADALKAIPEMHDRQIVATALLLQEVGWEAAVVTRDRHIQRSGLIPVIW